MLNILILVFTKVFYSKFFPKSFCMNLTFNSNILSIWITVKHFFFRQCFSVIFSDHPCIHMDTTFSSIKVNYWYHMYKICMYNQTWSNDLHCETTTCLRRPTLSLPKPIPIQLLLYKTNHLSKATRGHSICPLNERKPW